MCEKFIKFTKYITDSISQTLKFFSYTSDNFNIKNIHQNRVTLDNQRLGSFVLIWCNNQLFMYVTSKRACHGISFTSRETE